MLNDLTTQDLLFIFFKRWWILVIGLLIGGVFSYTYTTWFIDPTYVSEGTLYVNSRSYEDVSKEYTQNEINLATRLVETYKVVLKSDRFMKIIRDETQLEYSTNKLNNMIKLDSVDETEVLKVSVSSLKPNEAQLICQAVLINAEAEITRVIDAGSVNIIDDASLPVSPSSPNKQNNTAFGILAGLLLAIVFALVLEILDSSVKDEDDLDKHYDIPVVGSIPNLEMLMTANESGYGSYGHSSTKSQETEAVNDVQ